MMASENTSPDGATSDSTCDGTSWTFAIIPHLGTDQHDSIRLLTRSERNDHDGPVDDLILKAFQKGVMEGAAQAMKRDEALELDRIPSETEQRPAYGETFRGNAEYDAAGNAVVVLS